MSYTDKEFEDDYLESVDLIKKALSELDDNELYSISTLLNVRFNHIHNDKLDLSRAIFAKLREIRKDVKVLKRIRSSARELKSLL